MELFLQRILENGGPAGMTYAEIGLRLLLAFVMGQLVAWVYTWTHRGVTYSRSHVHSLILLCLIVTTVMLAIGDSLARAFGLFGALALIRFRTPIKDTRDTIFLFLAVGIGICIGTGRLLLAAGGGTFALVIALYLTFSRFGERLDMDSVLRLSMSSSGEQEDPLRRVLQQHCRSFALMHLRDGGGGPRVEVAYRLHLVDPLGANELLRDLAAIPGVEGSSLFMQNEDEEV